MDMNKYRSTSRIVVCVLLAIILAIFLVCNVSSDDENDETIISSLQRVVEALPRMSSSAKRRDDTVDVTTCVTGTPCTYSDTVDFRVIVVTFNRAESLSKLLRSLDTLELDGDRAALEIWIDRAQTDALDKRTFEVASEFSWKGGPTRVHIQV